jgi:hypothetical protein
VTELGPAEVGEVLAVQAAEMQRVWRLARLGTAPGLLPGLADGVLRSFFRELGAAVVRGEVPERMAEGLKGLLRVPPQGGEERIVEEWNVARKVLEATCEALSASPAVAGWIDRAGAACQEATLRALRGEPGAPRGLVRAWLYSGSSLRG